MNDKIFDKKTKEASNFFDNDFSASTNISLGEMKFALENMNPDILLNLLHIAFYSGYRYGKEIPRGIDEIIEEYNFDYDYLSKSLGITRAELENKIDKDSFTDSEIKIINDMI